MRAIGWAMLALAGGVPGVARAQEDPALARGEYLARAADCTGCHTRPRGAPFAGGLALQTPFGSIVSTNITPDQEQGIGSYTREDFVRALRQGRAKDGHYLYPAMPYTHFAKMRDADLHDLYAYFMKRVRPAQQVNPTTQLAWPFRMRWLMKFWNALYARDQRYQDDPLRSAQWNRGAYLVQGPGHCSACHTPRGVAGAEKATDEKGGDAFLAGAVIDGWYAQPLRDLSADAPTGLGSWSYQGLVDYLKTGRTNHTAAFGAMADVVANSTQYLSREDLTAMAHYLKSVGALTARDMKTDDAPPADGREPPPQSGDSSDPTTLALRSGDPAQLAGRRGAMVYLNNCAGCHRSDGQGARRTFPSLSRSSSVSATDPTSLIRIVLQGSAMPHTSEAPSALAMPGFDWRLQDDNVADVLSFVRASWGNRAEPVTAAMVGSVRTALARRGAAAGSGPAR